MPIKPKETVLKPKDTKLKLKAKKQKKQKQKQKQVVNQRVVVNLADTKPRRRVARRRPQVNIPQSDASLRQIVTQYVPIQSGSSVPNIVKYYNNIMTPKTEPIKDITEGLKAVRQQQQEDYTNAIKQSTQEEDLREMKQAEVGIINPLVAEEDDMDVMNRAFIKQAEDYNKKGNKKKLIEKIKLIPLKKRGRKEGSKNRSKEEIEEERRAKLEKSREKRNRIATQVLLEAQQRNQRIQEEGEEDFTDALKKKQDGDY